MIIDDLYEIGVNSTSIVVKKFEAISFPEPILIQIKKIVRKFEAIYNIHLY